MLQILSLPVTNKQIKNLLNLILGRFSYFNNMSYNIIHFEYGDLSGDGHDERDSVWLKTDLTKAEFEECLDGIKSELGFDFDDEIFTNYEDDILPDELVKYLHVNGFELIEDIIDGQIDDVHLQFEIFVPILIFLVKKVYEKRHPGQTILLEETTNPLPKVSRYWGYGLFNWG